MRTTHQTLWNNWYHGNGITAHAKNVQNPKLCQAHFKSKITSTPDDPGKHCRIDPQKLYPCNFPITFSLLKFPCTLLIPRDSHSSTHPLISSYYLCITFISICNNSHSPLFHKFSHKFSAISHVFFFSAQRERTPIQ